MLISDIVIAMLIISGISLACLGLYSRRFVGRVPAAAPYALLMFLAFAWAVFYALELLAGTLELKILFHNLRFLVLPFMAVTELWLVIAFVERTEWLRKDWAAAVLILPVAAVVLGVTSPLHSMFRYNFSLDSSGPMTVLRYFEGPFYAIFSLYSLVLLTLAIAILIIECRKRRTLWQVQTFLLILALALPTVINYLFLSGLTPVQGVNMTAPLLWISALLYTIALFRFRFLDIIPIARSRVIEEMGMPMIIVDLGGTVVDLNPAAGSLLGGPSQPLFGKQVRDLAPDWPEFAAFCESVSSGPVEFIRRDGQGTRTYSGTIDILYSTSGSPEGKLILLNDITGRRHAEEALRDSETFNRGLVENLPDYIIVYAPDGTILYVNPATERALGSRVEEIVGKHALSYIPKEHHNYVISRMTLRNIEGEVPLYETEIVTQAGDRRSVVVKGTAVRYHDSPAFLILLSDITERKKAEERLKQSEVLLRAMIESPQSIIIFSLDRNYQYLAFNASHQVTMKAIWGVDIRPGMNMLEIIGYESDRKNAQRNFDRALAGEHVNLTEEYGDETLGRMVWENTYSPIYDENNQVIGLTVYVIDITERKKGEEKLRKLSDRLSLATRAGGVGIWEYDVVNNTLSWDDQMFDLYGVTREQFGGAYEAWQAGVHPEDRTRGDTEIRMALSGEREFNTEFRVLRPDGSIRTIRALAIVQRDASGKPVRMIGTNWDITYQKSAEEALSQANRKLNLLSTITRHDINNQLTVLIGFLGVLGDTGPGPLYDEYLKKATTAAERITAIIRFTKEYENIGVNAPSWQEVRALVDTAAKLAPLGRVRVQNDLPAGMEVLADQLIIKVFYNLMDNATRYGGKITTIRFFTEDHDDEVVIVCEDDGVGVPGAEKQRIFERGVGKNTGLGLFLTREILDITGITIHEAGEPGKGARFEMTVPKGMWR